MNKAAQKVVDAVFKKLGVSAALDPDGVNTAIRLIPSQPDDMAEFGSQKIQTATDIFEIRASEFLGHSNGAIILLNSRRLKVQTSEVKDPRRLKRVLYMVEVA